MWRYEKRSGTSQYRVTAEAPGPSVRARRVSGHAFGVSTCGLVPGDHVAPTAQPDAVFLVPRHPPAAPDAERGAGVRVLGAKLALCFVGHGSPLVVATVHVSDGALGLRLQ